MKKDDAIKIFEEMQVRTHWNNDAEKGYFSIVDTIQILTDSVDASAYWRKLKQRLKAEGNQTVTNLHGLKMEVAETKSFSNLKNLGNRKGYKL